MESDSLENNSGLQVLEAENKHLKSMLNRFVSSKNEDSEGVSSLISGQITRVLHEANDFDLALMACLKLIGESYAVDRVSLFSFQESKDAFVAQRQWVNNNLQEYHPADLTISSAENPLLHANYKSCFTSSNFKVDLEDSLTDKFEIFGVLSLLIIPVSFSQYNKTILVVESCAFKREWYEFEVREIEQVVNLMAAQLDALWHKSNAARMWHLNTLRNQILHKIKGNKRTRKSLNETLKTIGSELGLRSVYIIDKASFSNGHELSWTDTLEHEEKLLSNQDLENLNLNQEDSSGRFFDASVLKSLGVDVQKGTSFMLINRVSVSKDFGGWLIGEFTSFKKYSHQELIQFWDSIALVLSEILSGTEKELEHNSHYSELLDQNRDIVIKEMLLDSALDSSPLGVLIINDEKVKYVNKPVIELTKSSKEEIIGKRISEFYDDSNDILSNKLQLFYNGLSADSVKEEEVGVANNNGELKRIKIYGSKVTAGDCSDIVIFVQDITENYSAQEKIRESSDRYQKIVESAIDGAIIMDDKHSVEYVNKSACALLGWDSDMLSTLSAKDIVHKNYLQSFEEAISQIHQGNDYKSDLVMCAKDGNKVEVELAGTLIYMDNQSYCYFAIHDISDRKKNEKALADSEREFRSLTQNSPDIILRLNATGEIQFFNQVFVSRFKQLDADRIIGSSLLKLDKVSDLVGPTWQAKVNAVFSLGETVSLEQDFRDEQKELYFDWTLSPEKDNEGKVETVLAIGRNLTPRKSTENELMLAKVKAEESDKLKSEFLANISHELRTPLNAIVGFSSLLRGNQIPKGEIDEYVDVIHKNSDSLMSLINNIIDVAKIESGKISVIKEKVNLDKLLQEVFDDFVPRVEVEHKGRVKLCYAKSEDDDLKIMTDPIRLRQVLVNLIGNAMKFIIKGFIEFGFTIENNGLRFYVKDTGIGITKEKQEVIFQPFCKGHEDDSDRLYRGTGIGLAICKKLVNALGGEIGLISEKGNGAEFFFSHPLSGMPAHAMQPKQMIKISHPVLQKNYHWPNKMMLLVDENSSAHLQMRKYIEKTSITLVSARTAAGASKLLMNRTDIHLVLMDMNFPDSDGYELVKIIKRLNKGISVIAHTAKVFEGAEDELLACGFDACIGKPADKEELLMLMDQFLVEV